MRFARLITIFATLATAAILLAVAAGCKDSNTVTGQNVPTPTPQPGSLRLSGGVVGRGGPVGLLGASLGILDGPNAGASTQTDVDGNYIFTGLLPATIQVRASKPGYESQIKVVALTKDSTLDFSLRFSQD